MDRLNSMRLADHFYEYDREAVENLLFDIYKPNNKKRDRQIEVLRNIAAKLNNPVAAAITQIVSEDVIELDKLPDRYISPDKSKTWKGIGKKPKWIVDFIAAGRKLEELENN